MQWNEQYHMFCQWYPDDPHCVHTCGPACAANPLDHKECHICWTDEQAQEYYPDFCTWYPADAQCEEDNFCPVECEDNPVWNAMCTDCWSTQQWDELMPIYCVWFKDAPNCQSVQHVYQSLPQTAPTDADCEAHRWDIRIADFCCDQRLPVWMSEGFPRAQWLKGLCNGLGISSEWYIHNQNSTEVHHVAAPPSQAELDLAV
jgi:hypothetical protein